MTEQEQEKIAIQDTIDEHGCQIIEVPGDNYMPPFSYTIGLYQQYSHPEIISFGLSSDVLRAFLENAKERIEDEVTIEAGKGYKGFLEKNYEVHFLAVHKDFLKDYLGYGLSFYNEEEFPVIQLVWPDKKGYFPWEHRFDENLSYIQPLLDRDMDFRFYESKNLGVFVTSQVLKGEPIRYVIHDDEGDWFFLEHEDADNDDLQIVSLESVVKQDSTINSIYYLQYGWEASRSGIGEEWTETESEREEE